MVHDGGFNLKSPKNVINVFHFSSLNKAGENSILMRLREEMKGTPSSIASTSLLNDDSVLIEDEMMAIKVKIHGMVMRYHISKVTLHYKDQLPQRDQRNS